ncbi:hypothetical protein [Pleurocapsa sp. PCC 7319]|uniref:hypothetical protein n=1 Tax=Pleurocapsa sp. PCC 7319 TaxID=118161 RepID=UPI0003668D92|nr:hypothetical protein [Pleurocapsa sp. PCC 7319]
MNLATEADYYGLCVSVLSQCNKLQDRFGIFDVLAGDGKTATSAIGGNFRNGIGTSDLKYGAAYYPYLQTSLNYHYTEDSVAIPTGTEVSEPVGKYSTGENGLLVTYTPSG